METVKKSIDIDLPLSRVYNQWTQFEEFPKFMDGVKEVRQLDDTSLHWKMNIKGAEREFNARIVEQIPDRKIAWRSTDEPAHAGTVEFSNGTGSPTTVTFQVDYEPEDWVERVGDMLGMVDRRVEADLKRFKEFLEERQEETGAWRGEIREGQAR